MILCVGVAYGAVLRGTIHSCEDDMPIIGAMVEITADSVPVPSVQTGNRGSFSVSVPDQVGVCIVTVSCSGYDPHVLSINHLSGNTDVATICLAPSGNTLDELTVSASASRSIDFPDKSIVFPTVEERERATTPLNLVAQLAFAVPAISVDEYAKTISVIGQEPQILINGVRHTYEDFNVLDPKNIVKIEYITRRDIRYGAPYINIITARPPTGGSVMASVEAPITCRHEEHQAHASYRRGHHEVSVNYRGTFRDNRREHSDETEQYHYPDRTVEYEMTGFPSRLIDHHQTVSAEYTLTASPRKFLVATGRFEYYSQGRRQSQDCNSPDGMFLRHSRYESRTLNPSLNVYGSLPVTENGRIEVNVMGSYQSGSYSSAMWQTDDYSESVTTNSEAYTTGVDLYYSHRLPGATISGGIAGTLTRTTNHYTIDGLPTRQRLHKAITRAYASLSGQAGTLLSYYVSLGATHTKVEEGITTPYADLSLQKKIKGVSLSYSFSASSYTPRLSNYSDVLLPVNDILYRSGNRVLKDEFSLQNQLYCSYSYGKFSTSLSLSHVFRSHPIMGICEYISDPVSPLFGRFLETTENGRRQNDFGATLNAGLYGLLDHYSVKVSAAYVDQCAWGHGHVWRNRRVNSVNVSLGAYFDPWQLVAYAGLLPNCTLSGNFLWRQRSSWSVTGSWHKGTWSLSCMVADMFKRRAYCERKTTMAIGMDSSVRSWTGDRANWVELSVRYQFSFGERADRQGRNVRGNPNVDSGVDL